MGRHREHISEASSVASPGDSAKSASRRTSLDGGRPRIVIVGAGLAGITLAIQLKRDLGYDNFIIYEKASAVGGTWRDNDYLGCGSDIPGHWYSLSTDLNPNWNTRYASQPELRAYWEGLWHKYGIPQYTVLDTSVEFAEWDEEHARWEITIQDAKNGTVAEVVQAEILFYATGGFTGPKFPTDVRGMGTFKGDVFHSSQWRHDVKLAGKRVGVIGNGCSAAQFVPAISSDPSVEVINFVRTPQWYVRKGDFTFSPSMKWVFANIPGVMRMYRNLIMLRTDLIYGIFNKQNRRLVDYTRKVMTDYIKKMAPKEHVDKLIPSYAPGCRRIIVDSDYLACLSRPNVTLTWEGVDSLVEEGIRLKSGETIPLDVVIFGTGYSRDPVSLKLRGKGGATLAEYFDKKQGPTAYLGSCYPGFPNMFTLLGPNVSGGHFSIIFCEEAQINHSLQLIKPILDGKIKSVEVTEEATDSYNDWVQDKLATSVWSDCDSYYYHYLPGQNLKTKNTASFPGPATLLWWLNRRVRWDRFRVTGGAAPRGMWLGSVESYLSAMLVAAIAYFVLFRG